MILVIGDMMSWKRDGRSPPDMDGFRFASLEDLDPALLREMAPEVVLSPLISDSFDAMDVARRLAQAGFAGRYRALTPALPNVEAVCEEVREVAPDLDFDLLVLRSPPDPQR